MRHTDILFFTLIDTVLHSIAYVRSWKAPIISKDCLIRASAQPSTGKCTPIDSSMRDPRGVGMAWPARRSSEIGTHSVRGTGSEDCLASVSRRAPRVPPSLALTTPSPLPMSHAINGRTLASRRLCGRAYWAIFRI